jgi:hypothetical protein
MVFIDKAVGLYHAGGALLVCRASGRTKGNTASRTQLMEILCTYVFKWKMIPVETIPVEAIPG